MDWPFLSLLIVPVVLVWSLVVFRSHLLARLLHLASWPVLTTLSLVICTVLGYEFFHRSVGPVPVTFDRICWFGLLAALAGSWLLGRQRLPRLNNLDLLVGMLFMLVAISTFSHDFRVKENLPLTRFLFFFLMPIGYYVLGRASHISRRDIMVCSALWIVVGIYLSLTAIFEVRGWYSLVWPRYIASAEFEEFFGRGRGPLLNPVANGTIMLVSLCSLLLYWRGADRLFCEVPSDELRARFWGWVYSIRGQAILVLAGLAIAAGMLATLTRSVWLGIPLAGLVFVWLPARRVVKGVILVGALVAALGIMAETGGGLKFKRDKNVSLDDMAESVSLRPILATIGLKMFNDRPWTGHGYGQYSTARTEYCYDFETDLPLQKGLDYFQHNVFLAYLVDLGLPGLLLLVSIIFVACFQSWSLARRHPDPLFRNMGLFALVFLGAWVANGMFHDVMIISGIGSLTFFLLGMNNQLSEQVRELSFDRQLAANPCHVPGQVVARSPQAGHSTVGT